MIRSLLLGGLAAAFLAGPAMAGNLPKRTAGLPDFGLSSTSVGTATNTAAGIGNTAQQRVTGMQTGPAGMPGGLMGPLVSTNVGVATNTAAGIGNTAQQRGAGLPGGLPGGGPGGVQVGLNMTGRGPLVSTNVDLATNVAAGLGNSAGQRILNPAGTPMGGLRR